MKGRKTDRNIKRNKPTDSKTEKQTDTWKEKLIKRQEERETRAKKKHA